MEPKSLAKRFDSILRRLPKAPSLFTKRRATFNCEMTLHEVVQLPYITGVYYVKWDLKRGACTGQTKKVEIKDHTVGWNQVITTECHIALGTNVNIPDNDNVLQPCEFVLVMMQEIAGQSVELGKVKVNMSEYVEGSVTRRYLLQDSKVNSWIKITAKLTFLSGESNFCPPISTSRGLDQALRNPLLGSVGSVRPASVFGKSVSKKSVEELDDQVSVKASSISSLDKLDQAFSTPIQCNYDVSPVVDKPLLDAPLYPRGPTPRQVVQQVLLESRTIKTAWKPQRWVLVDVGISSNSCQELANLREQRVEVGVVDNPWTQRII
jgi:hypothetical protein